MRPPIHLVALIIGAGLGLACLLWQFSEPEPTRSLSSTAVVPVYTAAIEELPPVITLATERRLEVSTEEAAQAEPQIESGEEVQASGSDGHLVRGTCLLLDIYEREQRSINGRFEVYSRVGDEPVEIVVEFTDGEFTFLLPDVNYCYVSEVQLDGGTRAALVSEDDGRLLRGPAHDLRLDLVVRTLATASLVVVDAATGAELSSVEVRQGYDLEAGEVAHPGDGEEYDVVLRDMVSPVVLPPVDPDWGTSLTYWVHCEGYAWKTIHVDHLRGGEYRVELSEGGDLHLEVVGLVRNSLGDALPHVRLRRGEKSEPAVESLLEPGRSLRWEGLPEGTYRASVEVGDWWDEAQSLGATEIQIIAGDQVDVLLEVSPILDVPKPVRCSGTIRAGAYWREQGLSFSFHPLGETENWVRNNPRLSVGDLKADSADPDLFHWTMTMPAAGTWQMGFRSTGLHVDFEAGPEGAEGIELVIPDPAELKFSVRNSNTGISLPAVGLWYSYVGGTPYAGILWTPPEYDPETETHLLVIPSGRIHVTLWVDGYSSWKRTLDLPPGRTEHEWTLDEIAGSLQFTFHEGDASIPANMFDWEVEAKPLDGEGELHSMTIDTIFFTEPGRYLLEFSNVAGYRPFELVVEVPATGRETVATALERE